MVLCGDVLNVKPPRASGREVFSPNRGCHYRNGYSSSISGLKAYPVTDAATDIETDKRTACDVYRWLREVCSTTLLGSPVILGGSGVVVQVDESLFRHKPKVLNTQIITSCNP